MLTLPTTLGHAQAASSGAWQRDAQAAEWQIDCADLKHFDSSALALLLDLRRSAASEQAALTIHNAPARLSQLAQLYGVNELIA